MKTTEWNQSLDHLDSDLIEAYIAQKDRLVPRKAHSGKFLRFGMIAAALVLLLGMVLLLPMLRADDPSVSPSPDINTDVSAETAQDTSLPSTQETGQGIVAPPTQETTSEPTRPNIPLVNSHTPSPEPQYDGSPYAEPSSGGAAAEMRPDGISVTAKFIEVLPDTYTFFDDWSQYEYRILRMQTVKLLKGVEMTEEFYYLVPVNYMTDFSLYHQFVILDMAQFGYDLFVMYNQSRQTAENFTLPLFGYRNPHRMGDNLIAFDANGNLDLRLWTSNAYWNEETEYAQKQPPVTLTEAEEKAKPQGNWADDLYVHLLTDITGDAAEVLDRIRSFENGIFVPKFSSIILFLRPEVQFRATRYINGFATNESVRVWCKEWTGGEQDTFALSKAQFHEEDLKNLPDLSSAMASVVTAYHNGEITPPHIDENAIKKSTGYGIFGWYAKTPGGVIGIVRVTFSFDAKDTHTYRSLFDDAYYIVTPGATECTAIDRDELVKLLGEYETTYIYTGEYNELGKNTIEIPPV
ncbi:MAG: hypothetical protein J6D87_06970 [Clostridia bacterium]|nr:hypothetical protein [Clostridia bacterium]